MNLIIDQLLANISAVFRNVLPGFLVLAGAGLAYPSRFCWVQYNEASHLLVLTVIAVVAGNTWYVFHRYGVHQLVDYVFYIAGLKGPNRVSGLHYADELPKYIIKNLRGVPHDDPVRRHVELRASSMHLMYIASEVSLFFSVNRESGSFFATNAVLMLVIGLVGLGVTLMQNVITRRIDYYSVELYRDERGKKTPDTDENTKK